MNDSMTFGCVGRSDKIGVLLAQLGTPDAPDTPSLRRYLRQFLSDPRVIELNRALWWMILNGIILRTRPKRSAALYRRVWTPEGSPLLSITAAQSRAVGAALSKLNLGIEVTFGMRYGNPSIEHGLDELERKGCSKVLIFPMYPQYAAPTTASTCDAAFLHLLKRRWVPALRVAEPYFVHPAYLRGVAARVNETIAECGAPDLLLMSYHGMPTRYVAQGDPYCCMCTETTAALRPLIHLSADRIMQSFQSRFGREPWLTPYTDETIVAAAKRGVKHLAVALPGFTADCLETIDEIGHEARKLFMEHGGQKFSLVPCINDHPVWLDALAEIVTAELGSWLDSARRLSARGAAQRVACPSEVVSINARSTK